MIRRPPRSTRKESSAASDVYKRQENDWSVTIFEKDDIVGGMCRTWKWGDYLVDTGPHIFHTPDNSLSQFWEKHFGDLFIKGDFWCKNVGGEKFDEYWDYPLSWESISRYPQNLKTKILAELNSLNNDKKARAINYSEYMEAEVGPTLQKMFFKTYPEKIWGISTDAVSYTHLRAHETDSYLVCRLLLEKTV